MLWNWEDGSLDLGGFTELNAQRKALAMSERFPDHLVIGADTLVFLDGITRQSRSIWRMRRGCFPGCLDGSTKSSPGFAWCWRGPVGCACCRRVTHVRFRTLDDAVIDDYLGRVDVLDKAGAYAVQEHGDRPRGAHGGSLTNGSDCRWRLRSALERW